MSTAEAAPLPLPSQRRLEGKVALLTGGAAGIGESIARLFHRHGAKVCIADINNAAGHALAASLGGHPGATFVHCNVTREDDLCRAVELAVSTYGVLDVMVNNAGISGSGPIGVAEIALHEFKKVLDVNLVGVFLGIKHAARVMVPRRKGSIITIASAAGVIGGLGPHAYVASKHAVVGLMKNAAAELGKDGIRVNCVSPAAVPTDLAMGVLMEKIRATREEAEKVFLEFVGRKGNLKGADLTAEDVAAAALYLASDEAGYVSGLNLVVDGGLTSVNHTQRVFQ